VPQIVEVEVDELGSQHGVLEGAAEVIPVLGPEDQALGLRAAPGERRPWR
jgi:hypothetical protein